MDIDRLREHFELGNITACDVVEVPLQPKKYHLNFTMRNGATVIMNKARTRSPRVFASLDAADSAARKIGFKSLRVSHP